MRRCTGPGLLMSSVLSTSWSRTRSSTYSAASMPASEGWPVMSPSSPNIWPDLSLASTTLRLLMLRKTTTVPRLMT